MIGTVAKKELRGYFNSAVAVIFLAAFLAVTLYTFFWREKFFARGLADLRPLFEWMPKLLIILVSALAMRMWADERRAGTLEVLLTLPVPRWKLVVGKFVAGLLLIAVGLGLTLGLPFTVAKMGNLDTGPVIGGYLAALLLSGAYLSIGMCVSAATDNQIVAFVGTAFLCAIAYAVGAIDATGAVGQFLGTGVRFESVARGVLDLRDLAYYGSIMAVGIALNVLLLGMPTWGRGVRARGRRLGALLGVGLIAANAAALNLWLAPVTRARIDLTDSGVYSLSSSTKKILRGLDEQLLIRGYFSRETHPLLAPLVPQIRDLLEEYRIAGGDKLRVEVIDPLGDDDAKRDAKERYDIKPQPLDFATDSGQAVVNAYFAIAIVYGDQHVVLGLDDLIQSRMTDIGKLEITLRNLEYQITKALKKVVSDFSSLDALYASLPGQIKLTAYLTPKTLPERWKDAPEKLKKVTDKLVKDAKGKLAFTTV
ncbi:MAG TPA: Gldg family protein, partial [Kofleriaceae bacterium]|nr:Gldg family protein [Kofleriaceae bacterium]